MNKPRISFLSRLLDIIGPRRCAICGSRLAASEQGICGVCNLHLPRTDFRLSPEDNIMARLLWGRIPIKRCAALYYHEGHSEAGRVVYDIKYHDAPELARMMGRMMAEEYASFFDGIDLLLPVPLTKQRQRKRGYNQAEVIAAELARALHAQLRSGDLVRVRRTRSQTRPDAEARVKNVQGVFALRHAFPARHVLLVDDTFTTGATLAACHRVLRDALGPSVRISIATLAVVEG